MADVEITSEATARGTSGLNATYTSLQSTNVYKVLNDTGTVLLHFKNDSGGARNVTIAVAQSGPDNLPLSDVVMNMGNGTERFWGAVPKNPYNDTTTQKFDVTVDANNVDMAAIRAE